MSVSVDGFVAGPNQELDWITELDKAAEQWTLESVRESGVHLMGSHTYYDMASYWPKSEHVFAAPMNDIPKAVFSKKGRLERPPSELTREASADVLESWMNPRVLSDLVGDVNKMKAEGGKAIMAHGGATFAQNLIAHGLVDEYQLLVHPVSIGTGMPLFSRVAQPLRLDLVYAKSFPGGTVAHVYRPKT